MAQIVIDANVGMALVLPGPDTREAELRYAHWRAEKASLVVPTLWWYESVSALRKAVVAKSLPAHLLSKTFDQLSSLGIGTIEPSQRLHRMALSWAERIGQMVAYDAQYLALAESLGAEFWTADRALARNARQHGAHWAHWLNEADA